jgi:hypothetical protein
MPEDEEVQHLADVLGAVDAEREADLAELEDVDPAELADWITQPDPDTDGVEHD